MKLKLHPLLAGAAIVVAFVGFGWLGFGEHLGLGSAPMAQGTGGVMEQQMDKTWNTTVTATPVIDAQQPAAFQTATFAVG